MKRSQGKRTRLEYQLEEFQNERRTFKDPIEYHEKDTNWRSKETQKTKLIPIVEGSNEKTKWKTIPIEKPTEKAKQHFGPNFPQIKPNSPSTKDI